MFHSLGHDNVETCGMVEFREAVKKIQSLDDVLDFYQKEGELHFDFKEFCVLNADDFPELKPGTNCIGFKISENSTLSLTMNQRN